MTVRVVKIRVLVKSATCVSPVFARRSRANWAYDGTSSGFSRLVGCILPLTTRARTGAYHLAAAGRHAEIVLQSLQPIEVNAAPVLPQPHHRRCALVVFFSPTPSGTSAPKTSPHRLQRRRSNS